MVPTYSYNDADDWVIRAYTHCPAYDATLLNWFTQPEFLAMQASSAPLRNYLAR